VCEKCFRCAYLGGLVFRGGKEVGTVRGELDVVDLVVELVGLDVLQLLTGLRNTSVRPSFVGDWRSEVSLPSGRTG